MVYNTTFHGAPADPYGLTDPNNMIEQKPSGEFTSPVPAGDRTYDGGILDDRDRFPLNRTGDGTGDESDGIPDNANVTAIALTPTTVAVAHGATAQLTATGTLAQGGTDDVSQLATWTSSNSAVAEVDENGLVTTLTAGSAIITATLNGITATRTVTSS